MWMQKDFIPKNNKNSTNLWQSYILKIGVKYAKDNVGFYFYLYPLDT